jgi:predicted transglutaminase-like cysteine proteinase
MTRTLSAFVMAAAAAFTATAGMAAPMNMTTGSLTSQPIGHHQFCVAHPAECGSISGTGRPAVLTQDLWSAIVEINVGVNHTITPMTDQEIHGVEEVWSYPTTLGDCEDYVLLKRRLLSERGFDLSQLLITVVLQPDGSGHAVLTVRTDRGDFVLDNMRDRVMLWSDTEYVFLKRQSLAHAGQWSKINDSRDPMAVGSVR